MPVEYPSKLTAVECNWALWIWAGNIFLIGLDQFSYFRRNQKKVKWNQFNLFRKLMPPLMWLWSLVTPMYANTSSLASASLVKSAASSIWKKHAKLMTAKWRLATKGTQGSASTFLWIRFASLVTLAAISTSLAHIIATSLSRSLHYMQPSLLWASLFKPLRMKFSSSKVPCLHLKGKGKILRLPFPLPWPPSQSPLSSVRSPGMNRQPLHSSHLAMAMRSQISLMKLWRWMFQVIIFQVHQFAQAVKGEAIGRSPELTPSVRGTISTSAVENMPRFAHHLTLLNMLFLSGDLIFASI